MKYTKQDLYELSQGASAIETYEYTTIDNRLHSDYIDYIGNGLFDVSEIDELPYDERGMIEADVYMMDKEEYDSTVNANTHVRWDEFNEENDKIFVIVLPF